MNFGRVEFLHNPNRSQGFASVPAVSAACVVFSLIVFTVFAAAQQPGGVKSPATTSTISGLLVTPDPKISSEFVLWWIQDAFDYSEDAQSHRKSARGWIMADVEQLLQDQFWSYPDFGDKTITARVVSCSPAQVAKDGTNTVQLDCVFISQDRNMDVCNSCDVDIDFVVRTDGHGYRIAGFRMAPFQKNMLSKFLSEEYARETHEFGPGSKNQVDALLQCEVASNLLHTSNTRGCLEPLARALVLSPQCARAISLRGSAWGYLGDRKRAEKDLSLAVEMCPRSPLAWFYRGLDRMGCIYDDQALSYFAESVKLAPDSYLVGPSYSNMGVIRSSEGNPFAAIECFTQAIKHTPPELYDYLMRAMEYEKLGLWKYALADYECALKIDSSDISSKEGRNKMRHKVGDPFVYVDEFSQTCATAANQVLHLLSH